MTMKRLLSVLLVGVLLLSAVPATVSAADDALTSSDRDYVMPAGKTSMDFSFTIDYNGVLYMEFSAHAKCAVYSSATGKQVWGNSTEGERNEYSGDYVLMAPLTAGKYYIRVMRNDKSPSGDISFALSIRSYENIEKEPNDTKATAAVIPMGMTYRGVQNETVGSTDVYVYNSAQDMTGRLYVGGSLENGEIALYHVDSHGNRTDLSAADLKTTDLHSNTLTSNLIPGQYCEIPTTAGKNYIYVEGLTGKQNMYDFRITGPEPIVLYQQPYVHSPVDEGETLTLTVEASGDGLQYTWMICDRGSNTYSKSSVTGRTYTVTMNKTRADRKVYCIVTDRYGAKVKTREATLLMRYPAEIVKQPSDATAAIGETVSTSVKTIGSTDTFRWYVKEPNTSEFVRSSITSSVYSYTMTAAKSGRQVYCVITDDFGNTLCTNTVTLKVTPPKITKQPVSQVVNIGSVAKAVCKASGDGLTYQWYFKNVGMGTFAKSSVTGSTYSYKMTAEKSGRQVYCVVTDVCGQKTKSKTVTLRMPRPKFTKQPTDAKALIGQTVQTSVTASGSGLTYRWYYANPGATKFKKSSVTTPTYSYTMTAAKSGRRVYCVITDQYGQTVQSDTVTLKKAASLKIIKQPVNTKATIGKTATVSVKASGDGLTYQWYFKNADMKSFGKSSVKTATYSYTMTAAKAGRQVYCIITDQYGRQIRTNTVTINR